ncbi:G6PDH family F420-dependent oxidoreductase [Allocatelliglobosispora scoriae]|uniref:G6PDH family F420-dependent oxidoreductase n=1 Tax=Allocatelliglobosispora scoriae TaxID=643052 RepID=A0A841BKF7_9ACTN|nr:TIGR03557 family F420-dependent LLM class oxidoreductase [Allocatelliglobosispora scoriae]MBB5867669.1 G6PDH family F420-dependent oxidoreductase [Allocatelliglobosispora scoriae]
MKIGLFLSSEEYAPADLLAQARLATELGMHGLSISDHFHPWGDAQGQSPFVWSMIGALSQIGDLPILTAVTCPTVRIHPAVIAQAAATSAVLTGGRFTLGIGSGEALNESILGGPWPNTAVRLEMLEEAVEVMRALWTGEVVTHHGKHYTVENARIYTLPQAPPEVYVSGFGPRATELAARIGDGYVTTSPDRELIGLFAEKSGGKPAVACGKGCFAPTADEAVKIAHKLWPNAGLPGELSQILPTPAHFDQAAALVTEEMVGKAFPCGPDPVKHIAAVRAYQDAGIDELYVAPVGPHYRELIELYAREVLPAVK